MTAFTSLPVQNEYQEPINTGDLVAPRTCHYTSVLVLSILVNQSAFSSFMTSMNRVILNRNTLYNILLLEVAKWKCYHCVLI